MKDSWEVHIWYSKKYDQFVLSDCFMRTWTCNQAPGFVAPRYIPPTYVYIDRIKPLKELVFV